MASSSYSSSPSHRFVFGYLILSTLWSLGTILGSLLSGLVLSEAASILISFPYLISAFIYESLVKVYLNQNLHTFVLYLGPHIASVTMAAYECGTTDFQEPPYPDSILCPSTKEKVATAVTIWQIMAKVRVESICWGAGTALGELPPYFMARAHRLSGYDPDEEDDEFEELEKKRNQNPDDLVIILVLNLEISLIFVLFRVISIVPN